MPLPAPSLSLHYWRSKGKPSFPFYFWFFDCKSISGFLERKCKPSCTFIRFLRVAGMLYNNTQLQIAGQVLDIGLSCGGDFPSGQWQASSECWTGVSRWWHCLVGESWSSSSSSSYIIDWSLLRVPPLSIDRSLNHQLTFTRCRPTLSCHYRCCHHCMANNHCNHLALRTASFYHHFIIVTTAGFYNIPRISGRRQLYTVTPCHWVIFSLFGKNQIVNYRNEWCWCLISDERSPARFPIIYWLLQYSLEKLKQ